ncbi:class I SAM-dependent methyltransferase [Pradoshia sp.]
MKDFISKQFKEPEGLVGKVAGKVMAFENGPLYDWTFKELGINNGDAILEIGFGPGEGLHRLLSSFPRCSVDGYDPSEAMVELAKKRNEDFIKSGRLSIKKGTAQDVLSNHPYNRIYSVNSFPMWDDKEQSLHRLHSLLKKEGTVSITVQPRQKDATIKHAMNLALEISSLMKRTGFHSIRTDEKELKPCTAICVSGTK